jgi:hypothetical protein
MMDLGCHELCPKVSMQLALTENNYYKGHWDTSLSHFGKREPKGTRERGCFNSLPSKNRQ